LRVCLSLRQRIEEERLVAEQRRKDKEEMNLYMKVRVRLILFVTETEYIA
jgi:hypothetical protein